MTITLSFFALAVLFVVRTFSQLLCFDPVSDNKYDANGYTTAIAVGDMNEDRKKVCGGSQLS